MLGNIQNTEHQVVFIFFPIDSRSTTQWPVCYTYYAHGLFSKHDKIIHSPAKNEYELSRGFVENEDDAEDTIVLRAASSNYDLKSW